MGNGRVVALRRTTVLPDPFPSFPKPKDRTFPPSVTPSNKNTRAAQRGADSIESQLSLLIRMAEGKSLDLEMDARFGVDDRGRVLSLRIPAEDIVSVHGFAVRAVEWNAQTKAIEGTLMNDLTLNEGDIALWYDDIEMALLRVTRRLGRCRGECVAMSQTA